MDLIAQALKLCPALKKGAAFVYILRLRSGNLYVGCSTDFPLRLQEHHSGCGCRTTKIDPPLDLVFIELHRDMPFALYREAQIKGWSRKKKMALIENDTIQLKRLSKRRRNKKAPLTLPRISF